MLTYLSDGTVELWGQPIIPAEFQNSSRNSQSVIYLLPNELLDALEQEFGKTFLSQADWAWERMLTGRMENGLTGVGLWNGFPITFDRLIETSGFPSFSVIQELGWDNADFAETEAQYENLLRKIQGRTEELAKPISAYLGWLMTNPQFLDEFREFIVAAGSELIEFNQFGVMYRRMQGPPPDAEESPPDAEEYRHVLDAWIKLSVRWRLQHLSSPWLPMPIHPQVPAAIADTRSGDFHAAGITDVNFLHPPGIMREIAEENRMNNPESVHLRDWFEVISARNPARNQFLRFSRWFRLQHYWKVLQCTYPEEVRRKTQRLEYVFAKWLKVSRDTIHQDLREIRARAGDNWVHRLNADS